MPYDAHLADRLRAMLGTQAGLVEQRMFGGCAFLLDGNIAVAASGTGGLLLRIDPAEAPALLEQPGASRFRTRGRDLKGWLHIDDAALRTDDDLRRWVAHGTSYARSLPPK